LKKLHFGRKFFDTFSSLHEATDLVAWTYYLKRNVIIYHGISICSSSAWVTTARRDHNLQWALAYPNKQE
jgi:hypothetical protein